MPVAALMVVRPRIEVKAIKSDSLSADGDHRQARAHVAIEAILSMPRYEGASRNLMNRGKNGDDWARRLVRSGSGRAKEACTSIDDLIERVVPVVQRPIVTDGNCAPRCARSQPRVSRYFQRNCPARDANP
jgi:hypothetical protein